MKTNRSLKAPQSVKATGSVELVGSAEAGSAERGPAPRKTASAAPTGPLTTDLAIVDSGNPPRDWRCAERRTLSSVRTSERRVKPAQGGRAIGPGKSGYPADVYANNPFRAAGSHAEDSKIGAITIFAMPARNGVGCFLPSTLRHQIRAITWSHEQATLGVESVETNKLPTERGH